MEIKTVTLPCVLLCGDTGTKVGAYTGTVRLRTVASLVADQAVALVAAVQVDALSPVLTRLGRVTLVDLILTLVTCKVE